MSSRHSVALGRIGFLCILGICNSFAYGGAPSDPCALLTQVQVSAVLGTNVEAAQRIAPTLCQWSAPNQPNSMNGKKVAITVSNETRRLAMRRRRSPKALRPYLPAVSVMMRFTP